jgi:hypothetical protein
MPTPHTTLTRLAQQAAAQIGFTVRRWGRDATDASVLRVEVERRLVGAPPAIAELTVAMPFSTTPRRTRPTTAPTRDRKRLTTPPKRSATAGRPPGR